MRKRHLAIALPSDGSLIHLDLHHGWLVFLAVVLAASDEMDFCTGQHSLGICSSFLTRCI